MRDRLPLVFIFTTLMIDSMGIGLIIPVMPDLIREVNGGTLAQAALWGGVLTTSFAVMQFLFGPLLGGLSDRFGRRPVLFVSLGIMTLDYLVMAVAGSIWLLLAGRIVGGITAATQSVGYAFVADISKPEEKAARFGLIGAAFGAGFVLGPILGGFLAEWGTRAPFYAAALLSGLNLILGILVLPETVTDRIRRPFRWARANPLGAFAALRTYPDISRLVLVFFLYQVAFNVYPAIWAYFTEARFGWDNRLIGVSLTSFGVAMALVQGVLIPRMLSAFGETGTVRFGFAFNALAFLVVAINTNGTIALILTPTHRPWRRRHPGDPRDHVPKRGRHCPGRASGPPDLGRLARHDRLPASDDRGLRQVHRPHRPRHLPGRALPSLHAADGRLRPRLHFASSRQRHLGCGFFRLHRRRSVHRRRGAPPAGPIDTASRLPACAHVNDAIGDTRSGAAQQNVILFRHETHRSRRYHHCAARTGLGRALLDPREAHHR